MKKVAIIFLLCLATTAGYSATSANQTVGLTASAINELAASGNVTITLGEDDIASGKLSKSDSSTSLSVTTNDSSKKITAALDTNLTLGSLLLSLSNLSSGSGSSNVSLTSVAQDVYSSLSKAVGASTLTYDFDLLFNNYASISSQVKQVTFTLTAE
ncbi:MAG: hypothetical protein P0S95_08305 [Rhabdochlamydiaceae bacterium]|nr:hypothetical protein [Candidatus Amphrikana amoebophyrae]